MKVEKRPNYAKHSDTKRIIEWNVDLLQRQLKIIIAHREARCAMPESAEEIQTLEMELSNPQTGPLDEVQDVIMLPKYDAKVLPVDPNSIEIDEVVMTQLRGYVQTIADMYNDNPFHNFQHARYVSH
jgi:hypothetical protein